VQRHRLLGADRVNAGIRIVHPFEGGVIMAKNKARYVLLPSEGMTVPKDYGQQRQFFQVLHQVSASASKVHSLRTETGAMPITVIDSIGEEKAKLIEVAPEDLPAFRGKHPSARVVPLVYYQRAVVRYEVRAAPAAARARAAGKKAGGKKAAAMRTRMSVQAAIAGSAMTLTVVSAKDGKPVAGAKVVAFTDFASRAGAQGTTNAQGRVAIALGSKKAERVYVYPASGYWPALQSDVTLKTGTELKLQPIDTGYVDCVRFFYGEGDPTAGKGLTVGVIDSGVATDHPDLNVQGGQNTVPGEKPQDFGDNGTEGHGTHVAGIIAAHGTAPNGIRGVAPGVTLRSYRVFGQGADNASNYAIAKAIDAAVADGCDLLNMSLGGGPADTVTAEAIAAAYQAGVVIFAATGNDDRKPVSFPASNFMCQAVAAMGRKGTFPSGTEPAGSVAAPFGKDKKNFVASFSNIGTATDLIGPGVGVISTVPGGYGVMSGTSMATPAETGAAARLLATKPAVLALPRDQHRAAAMVEATAHACELLGVGPTFEGKGMISR
jgi:subtilisin